MSRDDEDADAAIVAGVPCDDDDADAACVAGASSAAAGGWLGDDHRTPTGRTEAESGCCHASACMLVRTFLRTSFSW